MVGIETLTLGALAIVREIFVYFSRLRDVLERCESMERRVRLFEDTLTELQRAFARMADRGTLERILDDCHRTATVYRNLLRGIVRSNFKRWKFARSRQLLEFYDREMSERRYLLQTYMGALEYVFHIARQTSKC